MLFQGSPNRAQPLDQYAASRPDRLRVLFGGRLPRGLEAREDICHLGLAYGVAEVVEARDELHELGLFPR